MGVGVSAPVLGLVKKRLVCFVFLFSLVGIVVLFSIVVLGGKKNPFSDSGR